jgi:hypothetical protein
MDQGHEVDQDDDTDDESDVEKQRLRMTTSTMSATAKGKMRKEDRSTGLPESDTEPQQGRAGLHWPVIQVAVMDVVANALVTIGFFYVGSGVSNTHSVWFLSRGNMDLLHYYTTGSF